MPAAEQVILEQVSKRYGAVRALTQVSFTAAPGQVHALLGENGAGKSTLLKLLSGLEQPDGGRILLAGKPLKITDPATAYRHGIRLVRQEPEIAGYLSVAENVFLGRLPGNRGWYRQGRADTAAAELFERIGLAAFLRPQTLGRDLSPAQRQLVEVVRAVREPAKLIAFDEPTSSLGDQETAALFELIKQFRAAGTAIIYVTHRLREVYQLCDRATILRDGERVGEVAVAQASAAELVQLMVGRDLTEMHVRPPGVIKQTALKVSQLSSADVSNINLEVRAGEVVGLGGLVGSGRTELARAIIGDVPISSGTVEIAGKPVRLTSPARTVRAGIGLAPEERKSEALLLERTIRDNCVLLSFAQISRFGIVNGRQERQLAEQICRRLQVRAPSVETRVATLSGGNQQKVVLARWVARRPAVLILDEPTRGIDVGAKAEIYQIIGELAEAGTAILLISSDMPELLGLSDRIVVMSAGQISGELSRDQASEAALLELSLANL